MSVALFFIVLNAGTRVVTGRRYRFLILGVYNGFGAKAGFLWVIITMQGDESLEEEMKKLRDDVVALKHQIEELTKFRLDDRQHINKLEIFINERKSGIRRDYGALSQELVEFIAKRVLKFRDYQRACLNYNEVLLCLKLDYSTEAYRVMKKAARSYPSWMKYKNNGNKIVLSPTRSFAELVRDTEGKIWSKNVYDQYD